MRNVAKPLAFAVLLSLAPLIGAQENLGAYYGSLYFSTHVRFGPGGHGGRRRLVGRVRAKPEFNPTPTHSAAIERMVARAPAGERPALRKGLHSLMTAFPRVVQGVSRATGVPLRSNDDRDVATLAGVTAFQELRGKELTNAEFAAAQEATNKGFASLYATHEQIQVSGEAYALAIMLMGELKSSARNPLNKNPLATRQQLRGLALNTFKDAYGSMDYARFAPTAKGIEKVR